jgi:tRNA-dihydrouridine synthase B
MVSAKALWYGDKNTEKLLETCAEERPVAFQVFGSDPDVMAFAAGILDGRENVLIDVNMGCPVPKVVKNGDGSALMKDPDKAGRIIEAMCAKTGKPVTAKIRAGWDAESVNAVEIARVLEAAGAAMICVHARTRDQYYSGKADWDVIARVKAAVSIPVIGNGDVLSFADAERMTDRTGCDHVMIGRGALGNPWIFSGGDSPYSVDNGDSPYSKGLSPPIPSLQDKTAMFLRHAQLTAEDKGESIAVLEMRNHAGGYFKGRPGSARLRAAVNKLTPLAALIADVEAFAAQAEA